MYETIAPGDTVEIRKRMFYHVAYLMRHIVESPVNTINISSTLPDVKLYGYIDQANENLLIYYNNTGTLNSDQQLKINKIKFNNEPGCSTEIEYPITNEYIKGKQLYSGSGAAYMYDINPLYDSINTISPEINGSKHKNYTGPKKIKLFKNSLGVIKIPITVTCTEKYNEISDYLLLTYPNPASDHIDIDFGNTDIYAAGYTIKLYDFTGRQITEIKSSEEIYALNRKNLPAGIYFYSVRFADGKQNTGKIVFQ